MGHGEDVLSFSHDKPVNNLIWHRFKLIRSGGNVKLSLNGNDESTVEIASPRNNRPTFDPSFGVFVGGIGMLMTVSY